MKALHESVQAEKAEEGDAGDGMITKVKGALSNPVVRRGLYAGITVQVAQQFVGINTVMYYSPTIVQFAGFASNQTALALSLITSGLNVVGTVISMCFVDRYGRRRLMIVSMIGIITCLVVLSGVFFQAASHAPHISNLESTHFGKNSTCSAYGSAPNPGSWNCMTCLKADCGFCANKVNVSSPHLLWPSSQVALSDTYDPINSDCFSLVAIVSMPRELAWLLTMISGVRVAENIVYGTAKVVQAKLGSLQ